MTTNEANPNPPSPDDAPTKDELKWALKAFRKRLKLMRLDDESRIGGGSMSGGNKSGICGIKPPEKYRKAIWDELVKQGKLKYAGHGLYELNTI